jgi:LysR family transcriptional regulator, hypochlorite-specific transcription factor HypT
MDVSWLEDFLALADRGNFNRAAEARHMTQPAFSRRIRALEAWVGAPLFDRATHRVSLTPAGERFQPVAEEVVRRLHHGREEIRALVAEDAGTLRFAATHGLSLTFFPAWLRALEARTRLDSVHLISETQRACERILRQGGAQFLLCYAHPLAPGGLEEGGFRWIRVGDEVLVPVSRPDAAGRPLHAWPDPPACRPTMPPLLAYSPDSALGWIVAASSREAGMEGSFPAPVFLSHQASVLRAMALDGRGLAWLPLGQVGEDLDQGRLVRAGGTVWDARAEIRLYRPRGRLSAAAEAFWAALPPPDA